MKDGDIVDISRSDLRSALVQSGISRNITGSTADKFLLCPGSAILRINGQIRFSVHLEGLRSGPR